MICLSITMPGLNEKWERTKHRIDVVYLYVCYNFLLVVLIFWLLGLVVLQGSLAHGMKELELSKNNTAKCAQLLVATQICTVKQHRTAKTRIPIIAVGVKREYFFHCSSNCPLIRSVTTTCTPFLPFSQQSNVNIYVFIEGTQMHDE